MDIIILFLIFTLARIAQLIFILLCQPGDPSSIITPVNDKIIRESVLLFQDTAENPHYRLLYDYRYHQQKFSV